MKSEYLIGGIILLIGINLVLLYNNLQLQNKLIETSETNKEFQKIKSIPEFQMQNLEGKTFFSSSLQNYPYTLLIFFSPTDCSSCLIEKELWNKIYKENKVKIVGIANHSDLKELKEWVENSEIFFTVLFDKNSQVTKNLGIELTPVKILIDKNGRVLLVDGVRLTRYQQERFIKKLNKIILSGI